MRQRSRVLPVAPFWPTVIHQLPTTRCGSKGRLVTNECNFGIGVEGPSVECVVRKLTRCQGHEYRESGHGYSITSCAFKGAKLLHIKPTRSSDFPPKCICETCLIKGWWWQRIGNAWPPRAIVDIKEWRMVLVSIAVDRGVSELSET